MAADLAGRGWKVLVLEQRTRLGHKVCGEFISWEAQESLQKLGLHASVKASSPVSIGRAILTSRSGVAARFDLRRGSWGLSRDSLDTSLGDVALNAGAKLALGVRVRSFKRLDGSYIVEARSNEGIVELRGRALIAANGRSSSSELPPHSTGAPSEGLIGIKQHFQDVAMPPQVELYFFEGGYIGLAPIEGGLVNVCLLSTKEALEDADKDPAGMIEALASRIPGIGDRLAGGSPLDASPLTAAPVDLWRKPDPWDSIPCIGDAAAMIPPLAGDGIASALRSVELCAPLAHDYLCGEIGLTAWEDAYRGRWHASFDRPISISRRLEKWLSNSAGTNFLLGIGSILPQAARGFAALTRSN